jgi:hypothetical protein
VPAESIGARRACTVSMISALSMPSKYTDVIPRCASPSCRWMTFNGYALSGHLDRVRVTQPMGRDAPPHTGTCRGTSQLLASVARSQRTGARAPVDDAEPRADRKFEPQRQPWTELLPAPLVRRRADQR